MLQDNTDINIFEKLQINQMNQSQTNKSPPEEEVFQLHVTYDLVAF